MLMTHDRTLPYMYRIQNASRTCIPFLPIRMLRVRTPVLSLYEQIENLYMQ